MLSIPNMDVINHELVQQYGNKHYLRQSRSR